MHSVSVPLEFATCANVADDRQTDHATNKCVGISEMACRTRSDSAK